MATVQPSTRKVLFPRATILGLAMGMCGMSLSQHPAIRTSAQSSTFPYGTTTTSFRISPAEALPESQAVLGCDPPLKSGWPSAGIQGRTGGSTPVRRGLLFGSFGPSCSLGDSIIFHDPVSKSGSLSEMKSPLCSSAPIMSARSRWGQPCSRGSLEIAWIKFQTKMA